MKGKISITLDEYIIKFVDSHRGDVPRSKLIENYLKSKMSLFEVLWIFADEIPKTSSSEWISAHLSQPLGKPLHKHEGFIEIEGDNLEFYDTNFIKQFSVDKKTIKNLSISYDGNFKRFRDSRGMIPPMQFSMGKRKIYIFIRTEGRLPHIMGYYKGYNEKFLNAIRIRPKKIQTTEFTAKD